MPRLLFLNGCWNIHLWCDAGSAIWTDDGQTFQINIIKELQFVDRTRGLDSPPKNRDDILYEEKKTRQGSQEGLVIVVRGTDIPLPARSV